MNNPTRNYRRNAIVAGLGATLGAVLLIPQVASAADSSDEKPEVVKVEDTNIFDSSDTGHADSPFGGETATEDGDLGEAVELEDDIVLDHSTKAEDDLDWDAVDAAIEADDADALEDLGLVAVEDIDETKAGDDAEGEDSGESAELEDDIDFEHSTDAGDDDIDWDAVDAAIEAGDWDALEDLGLAGVGDIAETAAD